MLEELDQEVQKSLESAVMEIFSAADFHKASIRDVADLAGISFSTIYKPFGGKEHLLFACVNIWMNTLTDRIEDHLNGIEDLKEKLSRPSAGSATSVLQGGSLRHTCRLNKIFFQFWPLTIFS